MTQSERIVVKRVALLSLVLTAAACGERKERKRAELTGPLRVAVRQHVATMREPCRETGWRTPLCLVARPRVRGCLYLEIGKQIDDPLPPIPAPAPGAAPIDRCDVPVNDRDRLILRTVNDAAAVDAWIPSLVADPTGARFAFREEPYAPWRIFYLVDDQAFEGSAISAAASETFRLSRPARQHDAPLNQKADVFEPSEAAGAPASPAPPPPTADPPPDWAKVPSFEEDATNVISKDADRASVILAAIEKRQGEEGLVKVSRELDPNSPAFISLVVRLSEEGLSKVNAGLVERLRADGGVEEGLFDYFIAHREAQPKDFAELLIADVERQLLESPAPMYGEVVAATQISELARLGHRRAGVLACQSLGATWLGQLAEGGGESYPESASLDVSLLAAVVRQKTPCPWVAVALDRLVCSSELWCTDDGKTQAELDDAEALMEGSILGDERPPPPAPLRLCPESTGRRQAEASFGEVGSTPEQGPLLLAAAAANGPLPKAFLQRNARRLYGVRGLPPEENPDGGDPELPPCGLSPERVAALACALPLDVTEVAAGVCRLRLDDGKKTVTVEGPGAPVSGGEARYHHD